MWYEKAELEFKDPDGPEAVLVAYDRHQEELLMVQPLEALEDDLALRMSLLAQRVSRRPCAYAIHADLCT